MLTLSLLLALVPSTGSAHPTSLPVVFPTVDDFAGTWQSEFDTPFSIRPVTIRIGLGGGADGTWEGGFAADLFGPGLLRGTVEGEGLKLNCDFGGDVYEFQLTPGDGDSLDGVLHYAGLPIALQFTRTSEAVDPELPRPLVLPGERPRHIALEGLDEDWPDPIQQEVLQSMEEQGIVGLALGIALDGELFDARSWGWRDVQRGLPVDGDTRFRWASIGKAVTGLVGGKLALEGTLDLDRDVRELVPEYPEKKHTITTRQLLGHLAGMPHYGHMPIPTRREYDMEFPFRDPVRALDMFLEAPLVNVPGTTYSYSTHGFVLAGAVIERSSELGFRGEVRRLVSEPLGMTSFEPDDPGEPRESRTRGYRRAVDGRLFDSGDTNVAWKLAGGGFHSTVSDLARFGGALSDEYFVDEGLQQLLFVSQQTAAGEDTGYSLGLRVSERRGRLLVSHSGAQRRTRTHLVCAPREGLAVAIMCNTEGVNLGNLGTAILRVLLDES